MGSLFSSVWKKVLGQKKDVRLLMIGLDNAGKTTTLYKLKVNETVRTIPTIGFNVEPLDYKGLNINVWDVGGQDKIRVLWKHYYANSDGIIYVIDSNDCERIDESKEELQKVLTNEELDGLPLLIMSNKQDMKVSVSPHEIAKMIEMSNLRGRKWLVQGTSAISGQGLREGLDWMAGELIRSKK